MQIQVVDWLLIGGYFAIAIIIGLVYSRRASSSIDDFFVTGRSLPWWLAGTSMVATTFAADTPLAVTGLVAKNGIAGNWLWWNFAIGGMLTVFFYARLWRRAGVVTDIEFTEIRYSGKPAAILRGFRALYLAIPINCIIIGWVILAMAKILSITLGVPSWVAIGVCLLVTLVYSTFSGLWGVVITDFFQFTMAMGGTIILAFLALDQVGGMNGLTSRLAEIYGAQNQILSFFPHVGSAWMPVSTFLVYIGLQWWAAWYPGAEPGGGGQVAQRMLSTKNEKNSLLATLWFNIAHYALRPWPWIIVALVSMVLFPDLADKEAGYVHVMVKCLPPGFVGLLMAAFAAAFMSTISTQINWGSSYIVNDFYKRFVNPYGSEKHYVLVSRLSTVLVMVLAAFLVQFLSSISGAWKFLMSIGAGTGGVYIMRWFWWRINAWSEISAMVGALVVASVAQFGFGLSPDDPKAFALLMIITVAATTLIWVVTTLATKPESDETLVRFYKKVYPGGRFWDPIRRKINGPFPQANLARDFMDWVAGSLLIYFALFGIGKLLLGETIRGIIFLISAACVGLFIYRDLTKRGWQAPSK